MNKKEAQKALKEGKRITHTLFSSSEYVYMSYGSIKDEGGYTHTDFWSMRYDKDWEEGWNIVKKDPIDDPDLLDMLHDH